ncbi:MAG: PilZ domain-containing protein, partial [Chloroflexota bacterium]
MGAPPEQVVAGDAAHEKRRAPRAIVDIDGQLAVGGATLFGTIHDLSFTGSLFITQDLLNIAAGASGVLTFVLPNSTAWFKPQVEVRRTTTFPRPFGQAAQAVGFAFSGLQPN